MSENNQLKYENYKEQKTRLKRALTQRFFIEAIAIEYSIFEDRSESALRHAGIKTSSSNGNPITLSRKLNKLESDAKFNEKTVRSKMPIELIEQIKLWKQQRDQLIHALLTLKTSTEQFEALAEEGNLLIKQFDNKVSSLNRYFDKKVQEV